MLYITQLIYLQEGQEEKFLQFEDIAIPLMEKYNGKMLYRIRPQANSFVDLKEALPYEIHILSFDSEEDLKAFMQDETRAQSIYLKNESVKSTLLIKGVKL